MADTHKKRLRWTGGERVSFNDDLTLFQQVSLRVDARHHDSLFFPLFSAMVDNFVRIGGSSDFVSPLHPFPFAAADVVCMIFLISAIQLLFPTFSGDEETVVHPSSTPPPSSHHNPCQVSLRLPLLKVSLLHCPSRSSVWGAF